MFLLFASSIDDVPYRGALECLVIILVKKLSTNCIDAIIFFLGCRYINYILSLDMSEVFALQKLSLLNFDSLVHLV